MDWGETQIVRRVRASYSTTPYHSSPKDAVYRFGGRWPHVLLIGRRTVKATGGHAFLASWPVSWPNAETQHHGIVMPLIIGGALSGTQLSPSFIENDRRALAESGDLASKTLRADANFGVLTQ